MKKFLVLLLAVFALSAMAFAGSVGVNFTDAGYTVVTTQYLATDGVTFSNSLELTTGDGDIGPGSDYPLPPNGSNVITNDPADPITMSMTGTFSGQGALAGNYVYAVSGYYTSPIGVTVTAYNINGGVLATLVLAANDGSSTLFSLTIPGCTGATWSADANLANTIANNPSLLQAIGMQHVYWNAYHTVAAMAGGPLYPDAHGFLFNNYPPLSFYIVGLFGLVTGDDIIAGIFLHRILALGGPFGVIAIEQPLSGIDRGFLI